MDYKDGSEMCFRSSEKSVAGEGTEMRPYKILKYHACVAKIAGVFEELHFGELLGC